MPAPARSASKDPVNCPARSRTRSRKSAARSPGSSGDCGSAVWSTTRPGSRSRRGCVHSGADLDHEEAVQAPEGHRAVDVEGVSREHRRGLRVQELPPHVVSVCRSDAEGISSARGPSGSWMRQPVDTARGELTKARCDDRAVHRAGDPAALTGAPAVHVACHPAE